MAPRVIVSGLLRDGLGLAEATRGYAVALAAGGCEVFQHVVRLPGRPFPHGDPGPDGILSYPEVDGDAEADVVIVCLCPPELETLRAERAGLPAGRINVGLWIWDVDPLPASWASCPHRFDEIWSPTSYVTGLIEKQVDVPVHTAPPSIRPLRSGVTRPRSEERKSTILAFADVASSLERKNPAGAIEAFTRAFAPGEGPRLVVKIWNGDADPRGRARLEALRGDRPDVILLDHWLPRADLVALLAESACFLSLHRAEGFGLPVFEALSLGIPVVATGFSGPMDYLDDTVAYIVPASPAAVPDGVPAYPAGSLWAEPDIGEAAERLRALWYHPEEAVRRAERGRQLVVRELNPEAIGRRLRAHVDELVLGAGGQCPRAPLRPRMSLVTPVTTAVSHPSSARRLRSLAAVARAAGGEVIAGVATASVVPDEQRPPGVRVAVAGRGSEEALRAAALADADGDFVALVGSSCLPLDGWWEAYEDAYRSTGATLLVGVSPGPPLWAENCVLSREALSRVSKPSPGWVERHLLPSLVSEGSAATVPGACIASQRSGPVRSCASSFLSLPRIADLARRLRSATLRGARQRREVPPRKLLNGSVESGATEAPPAEEPRHPKLSRIQQDSFQRALIEVRSDDCRDDEL